MERVRVGVVGAAGYTGEELLRLLPRHPRVQITCVTSRQHAGKPAREWFPHLPLPEGLRFIDPGSGTLAAEAEVFFLALPHGEAAAYAEALLSAGRSVLDLSADFRIRDAARFREYYGQEPPSQVLRNEAAYGNPETNASVIRRARLVAVPGCYPTSVLLALAPALAAKLLRTDGIVVNSASGVSGAGRKADVALLFAEVNESMKPYGVSKHRHVPEIEQELARVAGTPVTVQFTPHLLPVSRGILTTIVAEPAGELPDAETLRGLMREYYAGSHFVRVCGADELPEIRHVARTNRCDVAVRVDARTRRVLFFSALDNLGKGAAGQAIQCLNVMRDWPEMEGLE
jgi:N-acetyl-gamma-glutamyl-phosphate reductase